MIRPNWMFIVAMLALVMLPVLALAQGGELPPDFPVQLATILGVLSPLVIQFINRNVKSGGTRLIIAVALSALIGFIAARINGLPFDGSMQFIVAVFALAQATFNVFWKPLILPLLKFLNHPQKSVASGR